MLPFLCLLLLAAPDAAPQDGRALRASFKLSERVIDDRVQQMTARTPFALLGNTRGAYLAGYGAVFTLEVNLAPVANISPFRPAYSAPEIQALNRQKREKLGLLKAGLRELLAEQAAALTQVPPQEKIAVVVNLFNFHWEDTTSLAFQVVMQGTRQALIEARQGGPAALERVIDVKDF